MKRHELTFEQWSLTEPLLASVAKTDRPPKDRGLRNSRYLITMVYLTAGKLDIELPDLGYTFHTKQRGGKKDSLRRSRIRETERAKRVEGLQTAVTATRRVGRPSRGARRVGLVHRQVPVGSWKSLIGS